METTKNKLSPYASIFFNKLRNYLETTIYFYGSIQRSDYVHNKSDIDVDIFTENVHSTITKLQNFFDVDKHKFKKFIYKIESNVIIGYKISIKKPEYHFRTEISIFDEKFKHLILYEHTRKFHLPFFVSLIIIILKFFYYQIGIIPVEYFKYIKEYLINISFEKPSEFLIVDCNKD
jgi:hypothetical protein